MDDEFVRENPIGFAQHQGRESLNFSILCHKPDDSLTFDDTHYELDCRRNQIKNAKSEGGLKKTIHQYIDDIAQGIKSLSDHIRNLNFTIQPDLKEDEMKHLMDALEIHVSSRVGKPPYVYLMFETQNFGLEKTQILCSGLVKQTYQRPTYLELSQSTFTKMAWKELCETLAKRESPVDSIYMDRSPRLKDFGLRSLARVCSSKETRLKDFQFETNSELLWRLSRFILKSNIVIPKLGLGYPYDFRFDSASSEDDSLEEMMDAIKKSSVQRVYSEFEDFGSSTGRDSFADLCRHLDTQWFRSVVIILAALHCPRLQCALSILSVDIIRMLFADFLPIDNPYDKYK